MRRKTEFSIPLASLAHVGVAIDSVFEFFSKAKGVYCEIVTEVTVYNRYRIIYPDSFLYIQNISTIFKFPGTLNWALNQLPIVAEHRSFLKITFWKECHNSIKGTAITIRIHSEFGLS